MKLEASKRFARIMDQKDPLKKIQKEFLFPKVRGKKALYFTGNSLGLQPRLTSTLVKEELTDWAQEGVEGHFQAKRPWLHYHKFSKKALSRIVGALPEEVVSMNQLTVNLHLLMVSFYRPTPDRYKIITEAGAFSSDQYAFESQVRWHGLNPNESIIELKPRAGEYCLRTEDILHAIETHGSSVALVIFGGVQYYTGQFFNIRAITKAGHNVGAVVGFDLAHAVGNVPLSLHHDDVDFAVWCSYKYLNSGPGGVGGAFVHEHHHETDLIRLAGWWGHQEQERFKMRKGFKPMPGADGWQLSNYPVLSGAAHLASLKVFDKTSINALRKKSIQLTGFLEFLLHCIPKHEEHFIIITPRQPEERGCQLSILMLKNGKKVFDAISRKGVIADWREPDVIRVAPVPLYNTFEDVFTLAEIFNAAIQR